jgi:predicted nucleotidyltransferase
MITRENITAIAKKIAQSFNLEKIILFGSYAWGKPEIDSDLDLFIVMESKDRPIKRAAFVRHVLRDLLCSHGYTCQDSR